jgi:hypothetical protein
VIAWESDNFTIRATEFYIGAEKPISDLLYNIIKEVDQFWQLYKPEFLMLRLPKKFGKITSKLQLLGYEEIHSVMGFHGEGDQFQATESNNAATWLSKSIQKR